jgi:hypothetical protein
VIVRELAPDVSVGFRDMVEGDRSFVMSSWLRGFHQAGDWPRRLGTSRCPLQTGDDVRTACGCCRFTHRRFFDEHGRVVEQLLARSKVVVACNPERPYQVIGYVVAEPGVLHWVFVKSPFRWDPAAEHHPRIGTALLNELPDSVRSVRCSHWTKQAGRWPRGLVYDPFALEDTDARA